MTREDSAAQSAVEQQLVTKLAALVTEWAAPEEIAILDERAREYFADPEAALEPRRRDEPLGFGIDVSSLGPYVLAVASPVVAYLGSVIAQEVRQAATPLAADLVRRLFRRPGSGAAPITAGDLSVSSELAPTLDRGHWIQDTTQARARALGLPDVQANILADAVVSNLVTRS
jgi:hypothetical protein